MGRKISPAICDSQQPGSWRGNSSPNTVRAMTAKTHRRSITEADRAAAARLREIWDSRARDLGVTQEKVAELLDGSQGLVSQYLNARIALNYRALLAFCSALQIEDPTSIRDDLPEQRLRNRVAEPAPEYGWEDVVGYAQAVGLGAGAEAHEYAETHKLKFRSASLMRQGLKPERLAVYYGHGDSMEPRIRQGDAILFDTSDTRPVDGAIYLVERAGEINVKRCEIIDELVFFRSDNPAGDHSWRKPKRMDNPADPIAIHGRVRWIGSWES